MVTRAQAAILRRAYYDVNSPFAFRGRAQLLRFAKTRRIKAKDVDEWLRQQPTYVLHKQPVRKFPRSKIYAPSQHALWEADLTYMDKLARWNDGYKYLLVVVDVFSKLAAVQAMKKRTATETVRAFKRILTSMRATPRQLRTDRGREFTGQTFSRLMRTRNINHYTTQDEDIKAGVVERLHRTLKSIIYRYLTANNTRRYIGQLQRIVSSYNNSVHSSIGLAPAEVQQRHRQLIYQKLYGGEHEQTARHNPKLRLGDPVLLALKHTKFTRGHQEHWRRRVFYVSDIKRHYPFRYSLQRENGQAVPGTFYKHQLQRVNPNINVEQL